MKNLILLISLLVSLNTFAMSNYKSLPIGSIVSSMLTDTQFKAEVGNSDWMVMNGQSCTGTDYGKLTGSTSVPNLVNRFLRMAKNDSEIGVKEEDAIQKHGHREWVPTGNTKIKLGSNLSGKGFFYGRNQGLSGDAVSINGSGKVRTASETRPKNMRVNYFIKVNQSVDIVIKPTDIDSLRHDVDKLMKAVSNL